MKQLLILSGKGGTGKTTITSAFIKLGEAKASADCDVDAPNLHLVMDQLTEPERADYYGLPVAEINQNLCRRCGKCQEHCRFDAIKDGDGQYRINAFACEGCGVCEYVCPQKAISLRPAVAGELMLYNNDMVFSTARLKMGSGTSGMLVSEVKKRLKDAASADLAIIDGSPGIGCPVIASLSGVDMVLIVAEPSLSGISDMERIVKTAAIFGVKTVVCINKYDTNLEKTEEIQDFCQRRGLALVGRIPFDPEAVAAINLGETIVERDCPSGRAVREIYPQLMELLKIVP